METFDQSTFVFEDSEKKIELVASVSFDRVKQQFKYSNGLKDVFGAEQAEKMMAKQS